MNTLNRILNFVAIFSFIALAFCSKIFAGTVQQIKNGKVLITLQGTPAQVGEHFFALNENNKKVAIIEITSVKGDKAVGKITKGATKTNDTILSKGLGPAPLTEKAVPLTPRTTFIRHDMKKIALNLHISKDLISTLQQDTGNPFPTKETVDMNGSNMGFNISLVVPLANSFSIQGFTGYEMLKVAGTSTNLVCDGKTIRDCNVDISYLTLGGLARYNYNSGSFQLWGGAGISFKQPLSKKSTALTLDNISLANTGIAAVGMDYHISNSIFVPASFEYHKSFNESETVPKIEHMALQVGLGMLF